VDVDEARAQRVALSVLVDLAGALLATTAWALGVYLTT
jgi:hypothetical protein